MSQDVRNQSGGNTAADFWNKWKDPNPRMALCMKITKSAAWGGGVVGFTTNSKNMTLTAHSGVTFLATASPTPTTIDQQFDVASVLEVMGVYESGVFTQTEVLEGQFDGAEIELFSVCWDDETLGEVVWHKGSMGDFKDYGTYFNAETRGQLARFNTISSVKTTKNCRALIDGGFRGTKCGHTASTVDIDGSTYNIEVTGGIVGIQVDEPIYYLSVALDSAPEHDYPVNFFAGGKLTIDPASNDDAATSRPILFSGAKSGGATEITLRLPFATTPSGDVTLTAGCAGTIEDCMKYENIVNRRAEDWIPTIEAANRIPDAR